MDSQGSSSVAALDQQDAASRNDDASSPPEIIVFRIKTKPPENSNSSCTPTSCACDDDEALDNLKEFCDAVLALVKHREKMCPHVVQEFLRESNMFGVGFRWLDAGSSDSGTSACSSGDGRSSSTSAAVTASNGDSSGHDCGTNASSPRSFPPTGSPEPRQRHSSGVEVGQASSKASCAPDLSPTSTGRMEACLINTRYIASGIERNEAIAQEQATTSIPEAEEENENTTASTRRTQLPKIPAPTEALQNGITTSRLDTEANVDSEQFKVPAAPVTRLQPPVEEDELEILKEIPKPQQNSVQPCKGIRIIFDKTKTKPIDSWVIAMSQKLASNAKTNKGSITAAPRVSQNPSNPSATIELEAEDEANRVPSTTTKVTQRQIVAPPSPKPTPNSEDFTLLSERGKKQRQGCESQPPRVTVPHPMTRARAELKVTAGKNPVAQIQVTSRTSARTPIYFRVLQTGTKPNDDIMPKEKPRGERGACTSGSPSTRSLPVPTGSHRSETAPRIAATAESQGMKAVSTPPNLNNPVNFNARNGGAGGVGGGFWMRGRTTKADSQPSSGSSQSGALPSLRSLQVHEPLEALPSSGDSGGDSSERRSRRRSYDTSNLSNSGDGRGQERSNPFV